MVQITTSTEALLDRPMANFTEYKKGLYANRAEGDS